ncbi:schlafen-like protein 1 [Amia ocellicauda]|uniref:schlafen-like protein 1 n=1 Tax=Amia ocellicauda TaxID=2972642 RepID=UPI003464D739
MCVSLVFPKERCFRWGYLPHAEPGVTQSDSAISRRGIAGRERLFYGAQIGSETRNLEFKLGRGHYLRNIFQHDLRKYACAFLNGEGGSLLVGVDNAGKVRGVCCNHRLQDRTRLMVDAMLKRFQPPLLPHNYNLSFLPVVQPGTSQPFLQVLRFSVWPPPVPDPPMLYQTDQGMVYLRRDASVEGPLTAGLIQQWFRQVESEIHGSPAVEKIWEW